MVIETKRLILRPFTPKDAVAYYEITQDEAIWKFVPYACPKSVEEALDDINIYYSKGDFLHDFYFLIEEKNTKEIVGALIVTQNCNSEFDMSLLTAFKYRKHGYMLEAVNGFINSMPSGSTLMFLVETSNVSSLALMSHLEVTEQSCELKNRKKFVYVTH